MMASARSSARPIRARVALLRIALVVALLATSWPASPAGAVGLGFAVGIGSSSRDVGRGVAVDAAGNVYVTGEFTGVVDFDRAATRPGDVLGSTNNPSGARADAFVAKYDPAGSLIWARSVGGQGSDEGKGIAVDPAGNVYVIGEFGDFTNSVYNDFDPGPAVFNVPNAGAQDVFVLKLDTNGAFVWVRGIGGYFTDLPGAIIVDSSGNAYLTGLFAGTADFDRTATTAGDSLTSAGDLDAFILRLNADGSFGWVWRLGGPLRDAGHGIAFGATGIYVTGEFRDTATVGSRSLTSAGLSDAFVVNISQSGILRWAKSVGGSDVDRGNAIVGDLRGSLYVTGVFSGVVDFDPNAGVFSLNSPGGAAFLLRLDEISSGGFVRADAITSTGYLEGYGVALEGIEGGGVYLTGRFSGTADFDPGPGVFNAVGAGVTNGFALKLNSDGSFVWARAFGGPGDAFYLWGTRVDQAGNIYLAGSITGGPIDVDPGPGTANLTSAGNFDAFALRLVEAPPTNVLPGAQIVARDSTKVFSAATFNQISVSAPDTGSNLRVLLSAVDGGRLTLTGTAGLTFQAGDGTADLTMTFTGTPAAVNAALDGLRYTPNPSYSGSAGIQIRSGLANGPTDTVRFDIDTVPITVVAGSCTPRPRVQIQSVAGGGQLAVTISSSPFGGDVNPLSGLRFGTLRNARVILNGERMASDQAIPFGPGQTQVALSVQRDVSGQAVTVPLTVVDACGPWTTFVGAGTSAGGL